MKPTVYLLNFTNEPEKQIACSAKLCYSSSGVKALKEGLDEEKAKGFVKMLAKMKHESPLEHASFTFGIEGVSRAFLAQFTRHRIASYSVQSQRYVNAKNFEFVIPPEIEKNEQARKEFLHAMEEDNEHYIKLCELLKKSHKQRLISEGKDEKEADYTAEKLANEDARFVLPNACATKLVCTFNARSLLNFFAHRCCNRAQWEIREVANQMLTLCKEVAPSVFENAGPACVGDRCHEGKMSCGMQEQMRKKYKGQ